MTKDQLELHLRRAGLGDHDVTTVLSHAAPDLAAPGAPSGQAAAPPTPQMAWERLGMSEEAFNKMPLTWRLEQGHALGLMEDASREVRREQARLRQTSAPQGEAR